MLTIARNKFFNKYLPAILSVVLLVVGIGSYFLIKQSKEAKSAWYTSTNGTWNYRQKIIIDHTKINTATGTTTPLTNFPVLINTTNVLFKDITNGGHVGKSDGSDIVFTSGDQLTKLDHEIETYASSTGQLIAWVKIPSLGSQVDTTIYMYYGNQADPNNEQNATGVWDSNFANVWHLPNGTSVSGSDSTTNGVTATPQNSPTAIAGQIDGAVTLNGSTQFLQVYNGAVAGTPAVMKTFANGDHSFSAWVKMASISNGNVPSFSWTCGSELIEGRAYSDDPPRAFTFGITSEKTCIAGGDQSGAVQTIVSSGARLDDNTWHYISATVSGTAVTFYRDGSVEATSTFTIGTNHSIGGTSNSTEIGIGVRGRDPGAQDNAFYNGSLDELRLSTVARSADWIKTEYNNQSSPSTFITFNGEETQPTAQVNGGWYNASWGYRKKIIINHTQVSGTSTLANFPVLVSIASDPLLKSTANGGHVASTTGADILFTSADGITKLNYEREYYASSTGQTIAWVQVPSLSYTTDTILYIYYGNSTGGLADQQNATATWDSNYKGVWHMKDGTTLNANDSTGQVSFLTNTGTATTGQIDGGISYVSASTQTSQYADNAGIRGSGGFTVETWVNFTNIGGGYLELLRKGSPWYLFAESTSAKVGLAINDDYINAVQVPVTAGSWIHLVATYDGANTVKIYKNGSLANTRTNAPTLVTDTSNLYFGSTGGSQYLNGKLDEIRFSNSLRSAGWIATEYNNESSPSTFTTIGGEETPSRTTFNAGWYSSDWSYRKPITIDHTKINQATGTTTPLTNFPVLINITDTDLKNNASSTGADILFTSSDGKTKLSHEIETYSTSTGQLIAWVQVPSMSNTSDTVLYMYFGNASAADQSNAASVWSNNYKGVWHLPNGSNLSALDSLGVNNGAITGATATAGQMDGAGQFSGSGQYISTGNDSSLNITGPITLSGWFNFSSFSSATRYTIQSRGFSGSNTGYGLEFNIGSGFTAGRMGVFTYNGATHGSQTTRSFSASDVGNWIYAVGSWDGSAWHTYVNGVEDTNAVGTQIAPAASTQVNAIGAENDSGVYSFPFPGKLDEIRLSNSARSADWIKTEYLNQSSPSTFASVWPLQTQNTSAPGPGSRVSSRGAGLSWYNTGGTWTNRRMITINHNAMSSTATTTFSNFPLLISIGANADNEFKYTSFTGGKVASSTGGDILFTAADGSTKLDHELEYYASSTGQTIAWVRIPTLSATQDTTIYMYYGNASSGNQQNGTGVWDSNYAGVWHMNQGGAATSTDSTINGNNGTNVSVTATSTGQIDGASVFNKTSAYVSVPYTNNLDFERTDSFSFSGWVNFSNSFPTGDSQAIMGRYTSPSAPPGALFFVNNPATSGCLAVSVCFGMQSATGNIFLSTATNSFVPYFNQWTYLTATYDGSSSANGVKIYINGVQPSVTIKFNNLSSGTIKTGNNWRIGDDYTSDYANGGIDEVEVSNSVRSADWIKTEYNNQSSPGTFYSISGLSNAQNRTANTPLMKARGGVKFH